MKRTWILQIHLFMFMVFGLLSFQLSGKINSGRSKGGLATLIYVKPGETVVRLPGLHDRDIFLLELILFPGKLDVICLNTQIPQLGRACMACLDTWSCKNVILNFIYLYFSWSWLFWESWAPKLVVALLGLHWDPLEDGQITSLHDNSLEIIILMESEISQ